MTGAKPTNQVSPQAKSTATTPSVDAKALEKIRASIANGVAPVSDPASCGNVMREVVAAHRKHAQNGPTVAFAKSVNDSERFAYYQALLQA